MIWISLNIFFFVCYSLTFISFHFFSLFETKIHSQMSDKVNIPYSIWFDSIRSRNDDGKKTYYYFFIDLYQFLVFFSFFFFFLQVYEIYHLLQCRRYIPRNRVAHIRYYITHSPIHTHTHRDEIRICVWLFFSPEESLIFLFVVFCGKEKNEFLFQSYSNPSTDSIVNCQLKSDTLLSLDDWKYILWILESELIPFRKISIFSGFRSPFFLLLLCVCSALVFSHEMRKITNT